MKKQQRIELAVGFLFLAATLLLGVYTIVVSRVSFTATKTTGTKTSNQSKGLWRISCSSGFMVSVRETGAVFGYSVEMPGLSPRNRAAAGLISRSRCAAMCGGRRWRM